MQENKFEKQVREEMEEFRIRPSATVWESVEEELRRKKRRRVVVYWFLLAAIGLGAYGIYNLFAPALPGPSAPISSLQKKQSAAPAASSADQRLPDQQTTGVLPSNEAGTANVSKQSTTSQTTKNNTDAAVNNNGDKSPVQQTDQAQFKINSRKEAKNKSDVQEQSVAGNASRRKLSGKSASRSVNKKESEKANTGTQNVSSPEVVNPAENKGTGELIQTETAAEESRSDATAATADHDLVKDSSSVSNNHQDLPENPRTPITVSRRRIKWGIEAGIGAGNRMDKALPSLFPAEKLMDVNNLPAYGAVNGGIPAPRPLLLPSESKVSVGFKVGVQASIPVGRKINLLAGLRYSYRSDRIAVGGLLDSSIVAPPGLSNNPLGTVNRAYQYQGAPHQSVTNSYHFIQLPVQWQLQLNKGRVMPITWEVGVTPGWLIHTNAMVYDTSYYGIYYRDKDAFSRFQLHAETGFSIHLGNKSKWRWSIGPEFNFALTPLIRNAYDPRQFLLYGGLRAQFQIPGKR
ncbi:MAG: outer membrane beta-barrel protein [Chitinophagaceae bacterium]|nr:outer membrane beta-barrel protein [Chitinophagaceae bacterium]